MVKNLRARIAYKEYTQLKENGYPEPKALQIVSEKLYHGDKTRAINSIEKLKND